MRHLDLSYARTGSIFSVSMPRSANAAFIFFASHLPSRARRESAAAAIFSALISKCLRRCSRLSLSSAGAFVEELIHDFLPVVEAGTFEAFERIAEVEKIAPGGHAENTESPSDPEPFAPCRYHASRSSINSKSAWSSTARTIAVLSPASSLLKDASSKAPVVRRTSTQAGGSATQLRTGRGAFGFAGSSLTTDGKITFSNSARQDFDLPDQQQIVDRAGIGNDDLHPLQSPRL